MFKDFGMYALKYFRDAKVVAWYQEHGIDRPVGYVIGQPCYATLLAAQRDANHINSLGPKMPVTVVHAEPNR